MRGLIAGGVVVGLAGGAAAQTMPGTPVGKPLLQPVGTKLPQAVPSAGEKVGTGPGGIPSSVDPLGPKPDGTPIKIENVVAPYPGMPKPEATFWEKVEARWFALFQSDRPAEKPNWTPGLARRNRERKEAREQEAMQRR